MKAFVCIIFILGSISLRDRAEAGTKYQSPESLYLVNYGDGTGYAGGAFASVRATANPLEMINCSVGVQPGFSYALCAARDLNGTARVCYAFEPSFIETVRGMSDQGAVFFMWDAHGSCTYIELDNGSLFGPSVP